MLGIHHQANAISFKRFGGTVFAASRNWTEQAQSSPIRPIGRRVRDLIQLGSSTYGMGHLT
jgi:hypothetical protein